MKILFFIIFPFIDNKTLITNKIESIKIPSNYKKLSYMNLRKPKKETKLFCKYDCDCIFPMTCFKFFEDYGFCHYDKNKMIPIPIPIPIDD